jgi:tetratricopeptide (TPR) repeat protein
MQVATWRDSFTVFSHATNAYPDTSYFGFNHLGLAYFKSGDLEKGGEYFKRSTEISPYYDSSNGNYGVYCMNTGKFVEAAESFKKAVDLNPYLGSHQSNLAAVYLRIGKPDKSVERYRKAIELQPDFAQYRFALGVALLQLQKTAEAVQELREGLRLNPTELDLELQLSWILATSEDDNVRNSKEAIQRTIPIVNFCQRQANNPRAIPFLIRGLSILAASYADQGRYPDAIQNAKEALAIARQQKQDTFVQMLTESLATFEAGKPIRQAKY